MIKQSWIAECDMCGAREVAKEVDKPVIGFDESLPDGWTCGHNKEFHLCPECTRLMQKRNTSTVDC